MASLISFLLLFGVSFTQANDSGAGKIVKIFSTNAAAQVEVRQGETSKAMGVDGKVFVGDVIKTPADASAAIKMDDGSEIILGPSSELKIEAPTSHFFTSGLIHLLVKKLVSPDKKYQVRTANSVMGVRGTRFIIEQDKSDETTLHTIEGEVVIGKNADSLKSPRASASVKGGFMTSIKAGDNEPQAPKSFTQEELAERFEKRYPGFGKVFLESTAPGNSGGADEVSFGTSAPSEKKKAPAKK